MHYKQAKSAISRLAYNIRMLSILAVSLIICNLTLGILLWHESDKKDIILIPANMNHKSEITNTGVNAAYLESIAVMLINNRLNITPKTVKNNNANILKSVSPQYYASFKKKLFTDESVIKSSKISSTFFIRSTHADVINLRVSINGTLVRWVGERKIGEDDKEYILTFNRDDDFLLLTSFHEIMSKKGVKA